MLNKLDNEYFLSSGNFKSNPGDMNYEAEQLKRHDLLTRTNGMRNTIIMGHTAILINKPKVEELYAPTELLHRIGERMVGTIGVKYC